MATPNFPAVPRTADPELQKYLTGLQSVIRDNGGSSSTGGLTQAQIQALIAEGSVVKQIIQNHVNTPYVYTLVSTRSTPTAISCLDTSISTKMANSEIAIDIDLSVEMYVTSVFMLFRVVGGVETEIGNPAPASNRRYGIKANNYDADNGTTMTGISIHYIDNPAVAAGTTITYKLKTYGDVGTTVVVAVNRTNDDTDAAAYERTSSNVRLTEFGGSPVSYESGTITVSENSFMKQVVQNHVIDTYDYTGGTTRATATELTCLTTSITTTIVDSKIAIDMNISVETTDLNVAFILTRTIGGTETEIGNPVSAGNRNVGISTVTYGVQGGQPTLVTVQYIDSPAASAGTAITYKLKQWTNGTADIVSHINHTITDTNSNGYERTASNVRLTEIGGVPAVSTTITAIANNSELLAGTDNTKIVTPNGLRQALSATGNAPIYACRAWVNFNGTGTVAIRASGNVSSITDNGTGDYTVNFTTNMENTNYSVSGSVGNTAINQMRVLGVRSDYILTTGVRVSPIFQVDSGAEASDQAYITVAVFR